MARKLNRSFGRRGSIYAIVCDFDTYTPEGSCETLVGEALEVAGSC